MITRPNHQKSGRSGRNIWAARRDLTASNNNLGLHRDSESFVEDGTDMCCNCCMDSCNVDRAEYTCRSAASDPVGTAASFVLTRDW